MKTDTNNYSLNDKFYAAELVIAVTDGEFEIIKSKWGHCGKTTLAALQRLLEREAKN